MAPRLVPFFHAVWGVRRSEEAGRFSRDARAILKVLRREWEMGTADLREASRVRDRQAFTRALDELQAAMIVVPSAVVYRPFTYLWTLAVGRFPDALRQRPRREIAVREIARCFLTSAGMTVRGELARVTGLSRPEAGRGNQALVAEGYAHVAGTGVYTPWRPAGPHASRNSLARRASACRPARRAGLRAKRARYRHGDRHALGLVIWSRAPRPVGIATHPRRAARGEIRLGDVGQIGGRERGPVRHQRPRHVGGDGGLQQRKGRIPALEHLGDRRITLGFHALRRALRLGRVGDGYVDPAERSTGRRAPPGVPGSVRELAKRHDTLNPAGKQRVEPAVSIRDDRRVVPCLVPPP